MTERDDVRRALDELKPVLARFLQARGLLPNPAFGRAASPVPDLQAMLRAMLDAWELRLKDELPRVARTYVHELIDIRNRWAHEEPFNAREALRAVDTAAQLAFLLMPPKGVAVPGPMTPVLPPAQAKPSWLSSERPRASRPGSQRDVMRAIYRQHGDQQEKVIAEYALAERRGEVERKSNLGGLSGEAYARALLADGLKKGWL